MTQSAVCVFDVGSLYPVVAPNNGKTASQIAKCASKLANQYSIAGILGMTESDSLGATVGTAFLGNTFSLITDAYFHVTTGKVGAAAGDVALGGIGRWPGHRLQGMAMSHEKLCPVHRGLCVERALRRVGKRMLTTGSDRQGTSE